MKKINALLLLLAISQSYCAQDQSLDQKALIRRYHEFINYAQSFEQNRPKHAFFEKSLKTNFNRTIKQAKTELGRLLKKPTLTKEELLKSHNLLESLWD